jgi:hypothetical protein
VGRRWVPACHLFFTAVASIMWATTAADGVAGAVRAGGWGGAGTSLATGGSSGRSMPSILGGRGAGDNDAEKKAHTARLASKQTHYALTKTKDRVHEDSSS